MNNVFLGKPNQKIVDFIVLSKTKIYMNGSATPTAIGTIIGELTREKIVEICPTYDKYKLTKIEIGNNVTSIGNSAFEDCFALTNVSIPDSVTNIGNSAFSACESLASITLPKYLVSIGDEAFYNCDEITSIILPNTLTNIGKYAFAYCFGLTTITVPQSVISIGTEAFRQNTAYSPTSHLTATFEGRTKADIDQMDNKYWGLDENKCIPGIK